MEKLKDHYSNLESLLAFEVVPGKVSYPLPQAVIFRSIYKEVEEQVQALFCNHFLLLLNATFLRWRMSVIV
jgi:hypothetical protein